MSPLLLLANRGHRCYLIQASHLLSWDEDKAHLGSALTVLTRNNQPQVSLHTEKHYNTVILDICQRSAHVSASEALAHEVFLIETTFNPVNEFPYYVNS